MKDKVMIKLNEDDILEILTEHFAKQYGFNEFNARGIVIGESGNNLRFVAVVGESEDTSIQRINLTEIDEKIDFNGSHSFMKSVNPNNFSEMKITDC